LHSATGDKKYEYKIAGKRLPLKTKRHSFQVVERFHHNYLAHSKITVPNKLTKDN